MYLLRGPSPYLTTGKLQLKKLQKKKPEKNSGFDGA